MYLKFHVHTSVTAEIYCVHNSIDSKTTDISFLFNLATEDVLYFSILLHSLTLLEESIL
jgi:hypothetical protein